MGVRRNRVCVNSILTFNLMPYLVDGYNLARARNFPPYSIQETDAVIRFLNRFARAKKTKVTAVFDGFPPDWKQGTPLSRQFDAVKIIFVGAGTNADLKLREMIAAVRNRSGWTVVSTDHSVHGYARANGIKAIRSEEFIEAANRLTGRMAKEEVKVSPEEMDYWQNVFGDKK